ncbi:hypothetical protein QMA56_09545 [Leuconostoc falkenbergense]|uniref:hypothetical protein n=1 Tax=Leuconostoc falkenbergense TaxID=2766470 RepID=UPI0024ADD9FD|nr:hypothetical protein [Leuconostoc falkenbergense]MDI6667946.1 hypothetical protein [Leuconostoc falkenbergense]
MEDINIHSKMFQFRALLAVLAIIMAIMGFTQPDDSYMRTFARATLSLLLSTVIGTYAFERLKEKKWLPFSAYTLVSVLNLLIFVQIIFPSINF